MTLDRKVFFDHARAEPFGGFLSDSQVAGLSAVLDCWDHSGFTDPRWLANILAQEFHETAKAMVGVREFGQGKGHPYGVPAGPYGHVYYGRGPVQLTWLAGYDKATKNLQARGFDVDLVKSPDDALKPDIGAEIIVYGMAEGWFTGHSLATYFNEHADAPRDARRIVNGMDKADLIAGYHGQFLTAIRAAMNAASTLIALPNPTSPTFELDLIRGAVAKAAAEQAKPVQPIDAKGRTTAQVGAEIREAQRLVDATPKVAPPSPVSGDYLPTKHVDNAKAPSPTGWRAMVASVRTRLGIGA